MLGVGGQEGQMGKNRAGLGSCEQLGTAAGWGACWELAGKGLDNGNEQGTGSHLPGLGTGRVCSGWWEVEEHGETTKFLCLEKHSGYGGVDGSPLGRRGDCYSGSWMV